MADVPTSDDVVPTETLIPAAGSSPRSPDDQEDIKLPVFEVTDGISIVKALRLLHLHFKNYLSDAKFPSNDEKIAAVTFGALLDSAIYYGAGGERGAMIMHSESEKMVRHLVGQIITDGLLAIFAVYLKDQDGLPGYLKDQAAAIKMFKPCGIPINIKALKSKMIQMIADSVDDGSNDNK